VHSDDCRRLADPRQQRYACSLCAELQLLANISRLDLNLFVVFDAI
jgi:hypothetical protein